MRSRRKEREGERSFPDLCELSSFEHQVVLILLSPPNPFNERELLRDFSELCPILFLI